MLHSSLVVTIVLQLTPTWIPSDLIKDPVAFSPVLFLQVYDSMTFLNFVVENTGCS